MDAVGWSWQYEPEGFELTNGLRYLPDFRIEMPGQVVWAEVKPVPYGAARIEDHLSPTEIGKICGLYTDLNQDLGGPEVEVLGEFGPNPGELTTWAVERTHPVRGQFSLRLVDISVPEGEPPAVRAWTKARQARFEFGESGA